METFVKLCPDCWTATALPAARCHECGHVYRTRFDPATGQAIAAPQPAATGTDRDGRRERIRARGRVALRWLRLLFIYAGPLLLIFATDLLKTSPAAPALLPSLFLTVLVWLWYLSGGE